MEAHKQFMRLSEGYLATSLEEDDVEDDNDLNKDGNLDQGVDGVDQNQSNADSMNQMDTNQDNGFDMGTDNMQQQIGDDIPTNDDIDDFDDTVIDVEDITNAQEKLNKKQNSIGKDLGDVDDRIVKLLSAMEKIQNSIEKNNNDITSLKAEIEKRVPTDKEKLSMQSLKMYPYNVSPNDYWDKVEKEGRYQAEDDEDKKVYKIREKDIDDYSDTAIEKSFDDSLNQTMKDIFSGF